MAPIKPSSRRAVAVDDDKVETLENDIATLNTSQLSAEQVKVMKEKVLAKIQEVRCSPTTSLIPS
jgi:hypothetical protein